MDLQWLGRSSDSQLRHNEKRKIWSARTQWILIIKQAYCKVTVHSKHFLHTKEPKGLGEQLYNSIIHTLGTWGCNSHQEGYYTKHFRALHFCRSRIMHRPSGPSGSLAHKLYWAERWCRLREPPCRASNSNSVRTWCWWAHVRPFCYFIFLLHAPRYLTSCYPLDPILLVLLYPPLSAHLGPSHALPCKLCWLRLAIFPRVKASDPLWLPENPSALAVEALNTKTSKQRKLLAEYGTTVWARHQVMAVRGSGTKAEELKPMALRASRINQGQS